MVRWGAVAGWVLAIALGFTALAWVLDDHGPWPVALSSAAAAVVGVLAFAGLAAALAFRWTTAGVFPAWKEPLLDPTLPPLHTGTPEEWLAGRSALGAGAAGSANLRAAAVRAMWWMPEPRAAVADLRWRVDPDPDERGLRRATRAGLRAARRSLRTRGGVRVRGAWHRVAGPDVVSVRLVVRSHGDVKANARSAEEAFAGAFEARLPGHRLLRET
ncbi:MAG TPA: hypothetical protein VI997_05220 [Candidatus Thermoplasmatota archaeon]|nr:hypothetical protein [Candidatus Thermoplasmatota archaeon]